MSFSSPSPKAPGPVPQRIETDAVAGGVLAQRRLKRRSGIVASFLGGASGEPGTVGKTGLTGRAFV